ncbi:MLP protein, partial [Polypterus senegalus]|nr:MLP protein [Polypterus senegalus]
FSDNGLVQFQSLDANDKYLFPNPPENGFQGNEGFPMLAVFWDDADLSLGDGKLFYQAYSSPGKDKFYSKMVFNRTAEDVNRFLAQQRNPVNFVPRWILKITWDSLLPTNTFQCILTTDNNRTFALLKFSQMLWGPEQRVHHWATMGYTNGATEFYNDPQTQQNNIFGSKDKDLLPFDWCCIKSLLCHLYYTKRPADNCSKQKMVALGGLFYGSLHFRTFDGMDYTFTGLGEYVILRLSSSKGTNVFTLQGLTDVVKVDQAPASVTAFMRLVAFYQGKGKVEWRPANNEGELLVLLDDEESPQKDFALLRPVDTQSVLVYSSGLQISVDMDSSGHLRAVIKVPQSFYNRTVGLLGQWNGDKMDDFLYSNGKRLSFKDGNIPTEKEIYDFGLSWTVPPPESLILSDQESSNFHPVFMEELLTSVSADQLEEIRATCGGKSPCIHDLLATGLIAVGMQTVQFLEKSEKVLAVFGNMPPSITGPSVIQCKVNFTTTVVFMAVDRNNDTISFSLLMPVPEGAIMKPATGELTWTPRNANPVVLTVQVNDQLSETVTSPVIQMCNCINGGTCDYSRIIQSHHKGKFQVVGCLCPQGFSGPLCSNITESCKGQPCFPGVGCTNQPFPQLFSCAQCPPGTVAKDKEGYKCFQQNLCLPPFVFPCHPMAECSSSGYNYTCKCKPGFSGDGLSCTDNNECLSPSACPNAKFECINTVGSVRCSCRYQNAQDTETCGKYEHRQLSKILLESKSSLTCL